jgi:CubicO group peptidase (beta-lactamase class C family)
LQHPVRTVTRMRFVGGLAVVLCCAAALRAGEAPRRFESGAVPPARFADPERASKIKAALPEVDKAFRDHFERAKPPGLTWGVILDGALVHTGALGVLDVATRAPADASSVFRIASMTKSFTALAVLKLRDEGRLSLDDPAARHVPELALLPYPTRDSPEITIRHLLTHSEGFPEDNPWGDRQLAISDAVMSSWMRDGLPFSNAPGVAYEYSNYGFAILGQIVARVSGMRYRDYVDRQILQPLGMTATAWEAASVPAVHLAHGHRRQEDRLVEEELLADGAFGAMGGLFSSVNDLARYVALFLSAWPPRDDEETGPVRRASLREMQQAERFDAASASASRTSVDGSLELRVGGYGFGLRVSRPCRFGHAVSHSGGLPGFGSHMRWLPEHGVGIVGLSNVTYAAPTRAITEALEVMHRRGALAPRVPQPSAALLAARQDVDRLLSSWDDALADRIVADNLFLDRPRDKRRAETEALRTRHGSCRPEGPLRAENALRGQWTLSCERGRISVSVTLAPTAPPRVQYLETVSALPLSQGLETLARKLASRIGSAGAPVKDLLAPGVDEAAVARAMAAAADWGACGLGEVREYAGGNEGDGGENAGQNEALVRLDCAKGPLEARLALEGSTCRLRTLRLAPPSGETCVP